MDTKVKIKKLVSNRRKTNQPRFTFKSDEACLEFVDKYMNFDPYTKVKNDSRRITAEDIALLTRIMKEDDEYFAENPPIETGFGKMTAPTCVMGSKKIQRVINDYCLYLVIFLHLFSFKTPTLWA